MKHTTLHDWLDKPGCPRTAKSLADALGVSKTAISLWRQHGVPMRHIPQVERLTNGEVTTAAMLAHALQCRHAKRQQPERQAA